MQTFAEWVQFSVASAVVLLLLTLVVLVVVLILKKSAKSEKGVLNVEYLNESWQKNDNRLLSKILKPKAFEALQKERAKH